MRTTPLPFAPAAAVVLLTALPLGLGTGCGHSAAARRAAAAPSIAALQQGRFEEASEAARTVIDQDGGNPQARLVQAITRYKAAAHQFTTDITDVIQHYDRARGFDHARARTITEDAERALGRIDEDLAAAARDAEVSLELCLGCWKVDWNRNGRVDNRDERLFQVELDAAGEAIPDGDPRRTPTFRFDVGDVEWARAMIAFQRAVLDVLLAYKWSEIENALPLVLAGVGRITFPLHDRARIVAARARIGEGLDAADRARLAYLAETDDDREWVPSPRQKSHPLPLPVDDKLYETWAGVIGDVRNLLASREGIDVAEAAQLGEKQWDHPPRGFLDLGRLLSEPRDIVLEVGALRQGQSDPEGALQSLFGVVYVPSMKPTPLLQRVGRMKNEIQRGEESFERKLRYLLWLN